MKSWNGIHTITWAYNLQALKTSWGLAWLGALGQLCLHRDQAEKLLKIQSSQLEPHQPVFSTKGRKGTRSHGIDTLPPEIPGKAGSMGMIQRGGFFLCTDGQLWLHDFCQCLFHLSVEASWEQWDQVGTHLENVVSVWSS